MILSYFRRDFGARNDFCSTSSSSGNQVDGLPLVCYFIGAKHSLLNICFFWGLLVEIWRVQRLCVRHSVIFAYLLDFSNISIKSMEHASSEIQKSFTGR